MNLKIKKIKRYREIHEKNIWHCVSTLKQNKKLTKRILNKSVHINS